MARATLHWIVCERLHELDERFFSERCNGQRAHLRALEIQQRFRLKTYARASRDKPTRDIRGTCTAPRISAFIANWTCSLAHSRTASADVAFLRIQAPIKSCLRFYEQFDLRHLQLLYQLDLCPK